MVTEGVFLVAVAPERRTQRCPLAEAVLRFYMSGRSSEQSPNRDVGYSGCLVGLWWPLDGAMVAVGKSGYCGCPNLVLIFFCNKCIYMTFQGNFFT